VDGCAKGKAYGRGGYCEMHAKQIRLHGSIVSVAPLRVRRYAGAGCAVVGCPRGAQAKGMCILHYERVQRRRHANPGAVEPRKRREQPPESKVCAKCGEQKTAAEFYLYASGYLSSRCRPCGRADALAARRANVDLYRQRSTEWYAANSEKATAHRLKWRSQHPDRDSATRKAYEQRHVAERKQKQQERNVANADVIREQKKAQRAAHREAYAIVERRNVERRRARLEGQWVEDVDRAAVCERDGWTCQLCQLPVDPTLLWPDPGFGSMDHITPLAMGGLHETVNVRLAHLRCNMQRGAGRTDAV
jgi:5-methylcytosine-specific restriction endonuclease McrA